MPLNPHPPCAQTRLKIPSHAVPLKQNFLHHLFTQSVFTEHGTGVGHWADRRVDTKKTELEAAVPSCHQLANTERLLPAEIYG